MLSCKSFPIKTIQNLFFGRCTAATEDRVGTSLSGWPLHLLQSSRPLSKPTQYFAQQTYLWTSTEIYTKKEMMKKDKRDSMINLEPRGQCFFGDVFLYAAISLNFQISRKKILIYRGRFLWQTRVIEKTDWEKMTTGTWVWASKAFLWVPKQFHARHGTAVAYLLSALFGVGASHLGKKIFRSPLTRVMMRNS